MQTVILWFRRNLRLRANAALAAAAATGQPIVPVYIIDEQDEGGASGHGDLLSRWARSGTRKPQIVARPVPAATLVPATW